MRKNTHALRLVVVFLSLLLFDGSLGYAQNVGHGVQISPDGDRVFVNKDVGNNERWAITQNLGDGTVTGNVFYRDGSDPSFVFCSPDPEIAGALDCFGANSCSSTGSINPARGVQISPDGKEVFVNKDVPPDEHWAIALSNIDGSVSGNVFFSDNRPPQFLLCEPTGQLDAYTCMVAGECTTPPCAAAYVSLGPVALLPPTFFELSQSPQECELQYRFIATVTPGVEFPSDFFSVPGGPSPATVTFTANSSAQPPLQGFSLNVTYPTSKGGFRGSADSVACTSNAPSFTRNDKDNGSLLFLSATASSITFPITITCTFDVLAGQSLSAGDIQVVVSEVTQNGAKGDPSLLTVTVTGS